MSEAHHQASAEAVAERIAREVLDLRSLTPRPNGDNYQVLSVIEIRAALISAYEAGRASMQAEEPR